MTNMQLGPSNSEKLEMQGRRNRETEQKTRQEGQTDRMADPGPIKGPHPALGSPSPLGHQVRGFVRFKLEKD